MKPPTIKYHAAALIMFVIGLLALFWLEPPTPEQVTVLMLGLLGLLALCADWFLWEER